MVKIQNSKYLQCPLGGDFFSRLGKLHSSQIRSQLKRMWGVSAKELPVLLRKRLINHGNLQYVCRSTAQWEKAFKFAGEWNDYDGWSLDRNLFQKELDKKVFTVSEGTIQLDEPTWLTLASLSFLKDSEKESPNHFFLKELFRLFYHRVYENDDTQSPIVEEVSLNVYGDRVRSDLAIHMTNKYLVCEVGGVQLWKVMALLYKGYEVTVMPHWTKQRVNPFTKKRLKYTCYTFKNKGGFGCLR